MMPALHLRAVLRDGACAFLLALVCLLASAVRPHAEVASSPRPVLSSTAGPVAEKAAAPASCSGTIEAGAFTDCVRAGIAAGGLVLDTEGGLVSIAAYQALAVHLHDVPVYVERACWSACLWLLSASPRPVLGPEATVGLHFVHSHLGGNRTLVRAHETRAAWRRITGRDDLWHAYVRHLRGSGVLPSGWQGEDWTAITATKGGSFAMLSFWFPTRAELAAYGVLSGRDPRLDPEIGAR